MTITTVNTIIIITVTLKMKIILSSNYFSFGILSLNTTFAWCGTFSLVKGILFFFIREVTVQYLFGSVTNLSETLVESNFTTNISWGNIWKCPERLFSHVTCSYLLDVFLFLQFQTIEKMVFSQVWLISCSNFMYENNDVIVTNARHMFKVNS